MTLNYSCTMAKELPYFKFDVAEWINGLITLESHSAQGLFINICAYYWFKSGNLSLSEIKRRLFQAKQEDFDALISSGVMKVSDDRIIITFLDDQLNERANLSQVNSANGKRGGRPKTEIKPTALISLNGKKANESNIEEKRVEESRREEISRTIFSDSRFMSDLNRNHKGKDYKKAFSDCWAFHAQKGTVLEDWEWRQKLLTWLGNVKAEKQTVNPGKVQ